MKPILMIAALGLMTACVSNTEYDRDRAYAKCDSISDESSRNRCIADAIQDAERDRHQDAQRVEQFEDNAERRELGREIAGAEKN
ncbi:MAG: hypothetical protein AAF996_08480 [Pseudomonadota bacterium]